MFLKPTFEKLITDIKAGVTGLKNVQMYGGEFEEDSPYDNQPPEVFIRWNGNQPIDKYTGDMKIGAYAVKITLFIVVIDLAGGLDAINTVELVIDFIDGYVIKPTGAEVTRIKAGPSKLLGYLKGGAHVYEIDAEII